jgi:asparagine synthase (glutamine-hydrolysing)
VSGFAGELCLSGDAAPEHLNRMALAMASWGADAGGPWSEGPLGLVARLRIDTPWNTGEVQPLLHGDLVVVAHARLDDRASLLAALSLRPDTAAATPDTQLVVLAWLKWGDRCVDHLLGDWVCAVWNRRLRRLWVGRDAAGNTGLYFWRDARRLVFSTSLAALLAHPDVPRRINEDRMARQLVVLMDPSDSSSTPYAGITSVPGGHAIECIDGTVRMFGWWQPESLPPLPRATDDDYYAEFRRLYRAAVADRLPTTGGRVALLLSGGLDSGSAAALAASELAQRGRRLLALTSIPAFENVVTDSHLSGDEAALAGATAAHIGHTDHACLNAANVSVLSAIDEMIDAHHLPLHAASNYFWMSTLLRTAVERGAGVVLTAQGGNATVSWTGAGGWRGRLRQVGTRLSRLRPQARWNGLTPIHPDALRRCRVVERARAIPPVTSTGPHFRLGRLGSASIGTIWMTNSAVHGVDIRDPTRDRRLLEYCWRLPERVFHAGGIERGLIRKGMADALPTQVLFSRHRGLQSADLGHRILADRAAVRAALSRFERHPVVREWLDLPAMYEAIGALEHAVTPRSTRVAQHVLVRGLSAGAFFSRF